MEYWKLGVLALLALSLITMGCVTQPPNQPNTSGNGLQQAPAPQISGTSTEQANIIARLKIMNDPSTTLWFYGLSQTGQVIFESIVKGKVTSSGKRLDPITSTGCASLVPSASPQNKQSGIWDCSLELIQDDGTYGSSDNYVYWFDYAGNYYQWSGLYIVTTKPLIIPTPAINFQTPNTGNRTVS